MKRTLAFAMVLLVCVPSLSEASHILTLFPDNSAIGISTSAEVNGFSQLRLQVSLNDLNLHAVLMGPTGDPDFPNATASRPWLFGQLGLFGQLKNIVQDGPNFILTWNVFLGLGGTNPATFPVGTLVITVTP